MRSMQYYALAHLTARHMFTCVQSIATQLVGNAKRQRTRFALRCAMAMDEGETALDIDEVPEFQLCLGHDWKVWHMKE